jgi:hypothetical protein
MSALLKNCTFPIVCPHCGAQIQKTVQWFKDNNELICPCGSHLYLGTEELLIAIEAVAVALMRVIRSRPDITENRPSDNGRV